MTEDEIYEAQGRANAALKKAKSNVAAIHTVLSQHSRSLKEVAALIARLLSDPSYVEPSSHIKLSEHLKQQIQALPEREALAQLVEYFSTESAEVSQLQQQVDEF